MSSPTPRLQLVEQLERDLQGIGVAAAAYSAAAIRRDLDAHPHASSAQRTEALVTILSQPRTGGFTPEQARRFAHQYLAVDALDDPRTGAGAVVFQDRTDKAFLVGVRGTDLTGNARTDLLANAAIALNTTPVAQTVSVVNFALRTTTPKNQTVVQIAVKGVNEADDDFRRGHAQRKATVVNAVKDAALRRPPTPAATLEPYAAGVAKGHGTALGPCKAVGAHSKGGPETAVANGAWQCTRLVTYNAPHTSMTEAQTLVNFTTRAAGLPSVDLSEMHRDHLVGSGWNWIAGLNAPATESTKVLPIPNSINPVSNHSVQVGVWAAEARLQVALENPHFTSIEQVDERLRQLWQTPSPTISTSSVASALSAQARQAITQLAQHHQWSASQLQSFFQALAKERLQTVPTPAPNFPRTR